KNGDRLAVTTEAIDIPDKNSVRLQPNSRVTGSMNMFIEPVITPRNENPMKQVSSSGQPRFHSFMAAWRDSTCNKPSPILAPARSLVGSRFGSLQRPEWRYRFRPISKPSGLSHGELDGRFGTPA